MVSFSKIFIFRNKSNHLEQIQTMSIWNEERLNLMKLKFEDIMSLRSVSLDDYEMFTSPWAVTKQEENMFAKTIELVRTFHYILIIVGGPFPPPMA